MPFHGFFQHVNEGIILEDDCIPHPDFFSYCSILLNRYRHDTRIWCISGSNFQDGQWRGDGSYYFSRYNHCWGWASWRRSWQHYDADLSQWTRLYDGGFLRTIFDDSVERHHWKQIWQCLLEKGRPDSWAYRWTFTCLINGALTALPNRNLVENVGFGEDATHTKGSAINTGITEGVDPNLHPTFLYCVTLLLIAIHTIIILVASGKVPLYHCCVFLGELQGLFFARRERLFHDIIDAA